MAYRFRFDALLNIRTRRLELAESELGRILREVFQAKEEYASLSKSIKEVIDTVDSRLAEGMSASEYQHSTGFLERLKSERDRLLKEIASLEKKADDARKKVRRCLMEKEIVERLKEKDYRKYLEKQKRIEQKEADEISSQRYGRRTHGLAY